MAKPTPDTDPTIEALLEQRAQYEQWLARLDATGDKAPARGAGRRCAATTRRGSAASSTSCGGTAPRSRRSSTASARRRRGWTSERRQAEEALAEAEVRHAVGEYGEEEWQRISRESNEGLSRLRGELRSVGDEIARLAEVQSLIGGAPKTAEPAAVHVAEPVAEPVEVEPEPEPEPIRAPEPVREPVRASDAGCGFVPRAGPSPGQRKQRRPRRWTSWRFSSRSAKRSGGPRRHRRRAGPAIRGRRPRSGRPSRTRPRGRRPRRASRARPGSPRRSSAASAERSTGRRSGTANAAAPSWPGSDSG